MKRSFFQAAVVSIQLYGCTTWTVTKRLEKKLDGNYTRTSRAILNKSWRQHPTRHQLYGHLSPITKTIQVRRTRHAGHCFDELINDVLLWTPTYVRAKAEGPARTYIQQLCEDTGCSPEDLPEAMNDREKWWEWVRDIRAGGTTWWWWSHSLNVKTDLFQTIQFSISTQFSSIWPLNRILPGATTSRHSEPGSGGNEGLLRIPQSSCITEALQWNCLMSYLGHSLDESYLQQKCSQCILQPQPPGPSEYIVKFFMNYILLTRNYLWINPLRTYGKKSVHGGATQALF